MQEFCPETPSSGIRVTCVRYNEIRGHFYMIQTLFGSVEQEPNLLERLKAGIEKTRAGLTDRLEDAFAGRKEIDAELLDEVEYTLITADIGVNTTSEILESIRQRVDRHLASDAMEVKGLIREHLLESPAGAPNAQCSTCTSRPPS